MEFKTDGELYDESLTRNTYKQAEKLKERIEKRIERVGYLNITWLVVRFSKLPIPKNWTYAFSHGWTKEDIPNFQIKEMKDGRFAVYVGTPKKVKQII